MKVLIIGASGYIGYPVALAYVRAGHQVFGVTRTAAKGLKLQAEEITPVIASSPEEWSHLVEQLDIVIDAGAATGPEAANHTLEVLSAAAKDRPAHLRLTYIYTSGTWCYGNSAEMNDERNGRHTVAAEALIGWRPPVDDAVVSSNVINGIVIRPGMVYGRSASIFGLLFQAALTAQKDGSAMLTWAATPGNRWATIHQDDLADLFLRVGEAAPVTKKVIFDAVNPASESVEDILASVCKLVGGLKHVYRAPATPFEEAVDTNALTRPSLGAALVGWRVKKMSFVDGLEGYWKTWLAHQEIEA